MSTWLEAEPSCFIVFAFNICEGRINPCCSSCLSGQRRCSFMQPRTGVLMIRARSRCSCANDRTRQVREGEPILRTNTAISAKLSVAPHDTMTSYCFPVVYQPSAIEMSFASNESQTVQTSMNAFTQVPDLAPSSLGYDDASSASSGRKRKRERSPTQQTSTAFTVASRKLICSRINSEICWNCESSVVEFCHVIGQHDPAVSCIHRCVRNEIVTNRHRTKACDLKG